MDKITAGLEELSHGITQGLSNILPGRRRSKPGSESPSTSRSASPPEESEEPPPEYGVDFEVEEEQVMKGLALMYHDKLSEADEYFETLKAGHARFSLHHAEVWSYVALISFEPEDVDFAVALLKDTTSLAVEQARRWRTHSRLKKVAVAAQETVEAVTNWARKSAATALSKAGPAGAQASAKLMPRENTDSIADDDDDEVVDMSHSTQDQSHKRSRAEVAANHRARRMRLWALLIQGECHLMTSLLQVVAVGESWTDVVKMGYNVKRTWSIYNQCQKKLKHLQTEWVALGGTFTDIGELKAHPDVDYNDDSDDEPDILSKLAQEGASSSFSQPANRSRSQIQNYDPVVAAPMGKMVYEGVRAAIGNLEKLEEDVKEDQELASLRIGVQFGVGTFNLLVSLIPANYQRAIELIGVPGDRNYGLAILRKVASLHHCRAPLAAVVLLQYYTVVMGLLPYSKENAIGALNILKMLPIVWKESSTFRILHTRLATYEGRLQASTATLEKLYESMSSVDPESQEGRLLLKLRSLLLSEYAWALFLQGDFVKASEKFGLLYKKTQAFKPLFAFLQSACFWEADEKYHHEAAKMLRDIPGIVAGKKTTPTSMEQFALRVAKDFVEHGQVPLFPALETIAVYNGFHHMDKITLKRHMDRIEDALTSKSPRRASEYLVGDEDLSADARDDHRERSTAATSTAATAMSSKAANGGSGASPGQAMQGHRKIAFQSRSVKIAYPQEDDDDDDDKTPALAEASSVAAVTAKERGGGGSRLQHRWTKESRVLSRYLLGLCQRNLGEMKQAEANFRQVVSQTNLDPGNVVPYACFEWGSVLLDDTATSAEGLNLLEKSAQFPAHEFQTRLKFVVSERLRMFRRTCETNLTSSAEEGATLASALNLRRVSEILRTGSARDHP